MPKPYTFFMSSCAALYLAACGGMFLLQKSLIHQPSREISAPAAHGMSGVTVDHIETSDGARLEIWQAAAQVGQPTFVFFHGNGGNLGHRAPLLRALQAEGWGFVALDYRGYGNSSGAPSFAQNVEDARLLMRRLPPGEIILYGESLGTGIATLMATEYDVSGLILQSAYSSVREATKARYPWLPVNLLLTERYSNIDHIAKVRAPILLIHGDRDGLFPLDMPREIAAAAKVPVTEAYQPGAGHNDLDLGRIIAEIRNFLRKKP